MYSTGGETKDAWKSGATEALQDKNDDMGPKEYRSLKS